MVLIHLDLFFSYVVNVILTCDLDVWVLSDHETPLSSFLFSIEEDGSRHS